MNLRAFYARFPELNPALRGHFTADETPPADGDGGGSTGDSLDDVADADLAAVKEALRKERRRSADLEKSEKRAATKLTELSELSPEAYKVVSDRADKAEKELERVQLLLEQQKTTLEQKFGQQLAEKNTELTTLQKQQQSDKLRNKLERLFVAAGGRKGASTPRNRTFFDMFHDDVATDFAFDDKGELMVVDAQGDPVLDSESGKRVKPLDHVTKLKVDPILGWTFEPEHGSGSGSNTSSAPRFQTSVDLQKLTNSERMKHAFGNIPGRK